MTSEKNLLNQNLAGDIDDKNPLCDSSTGQICDKNDELVRLLNDIIKDAEESKPAQIAENHLKKFEEIYSGDFRHSYSHLTQYFCVDFYQKSQLNKLGLLVSYLKSVEQSNDKNESLVKNKLAKLIDHVELEYQRLNLMGEAKKELIELKNEAEKAKNELQDAKAKAEDAKNDAVAAKKEAEDAVKKADDAAKDIRKELITIVGILSAVLIGSVGSMMFGSKMFDNLDKVSVAKLTFGFLFVGVLFVLVLNMLLSFLRDVNGKNTKPFWSLSEENSLNLILILILSILCSLGAYFLLTLVTTDLQYIYKF